MGGGCFHFYRCLRCLEFIWWNNLKDCFLPVSPRTPKAHSIFYKVLEEGPILTGASASLSTKCKRKI